MTAQKSSKNKAFKHSVICALREGGVLAAVYTVVLFFAWAFFPIMIVCMLAAQGDGLGGSFTFVAAVDGTDGLAIMILSAIIPFSFFTAMLLFRFGFKRNSANVYRSLGISARELFASRFLAGTVLVCAPILFSFITLVIMNIAVSGLKTAMLLSGLYFFFTLIACAMTVYAITVCVFICSGHIVEASAFSVIMNFAPTIITKFAARIFVGVPGYISKRGFYLNFYGYLTERSYGAAELLELTWHSPVLLAADAVENYSYSNASGITYNLTDGGQAATINIGSLPNLLPLIFWLAVPALLCLLGMRLLEKHRSENCASFGKSRGMNFLVSTTLGILAASVFLETTNRLVPNGSSVYLIAALVISAAVYLVFEFTFTHNIRIFGSELKKLPIFVGIFFLTVIAIRVGGIGYTRAIPKMEDVSAVYFKTPTDIHMSNPSYYRRDYTGAESAEETWKAGSFTSTSLNPKESHWMQNINLPEDKEKILAIHEQCVNNTRGDGENPTDVIFYYVMSDGDVFVRRFTVNLDDKETAKAVANAEDTEWYKERVKLHLTGEADIALNGNEYSHQSDISGLRLISRNALNSKNVMDTLQYFDMLDFMEIVSADLEKQTAEQKYFSEDGIVGFISAFPQFDAEQAEKYGEEGYPFDDRYNYEAEALYSHYIYDPDRTVMLIPITQDMEDTIKYLKEHDLYKYFSDDGGGNLTAARAVKFVRYAGDEAGTFLSLRIQEKYSDRYTDKYLRDIGRMDGDITDSAQVAELFNLSKAYCLAGDGYIVSFANDNGDVIFRYLPADSAPDYIK